MYIKLLTKEGYEAISERNMERLGLPPQFVRGVYSDEEVYQVVLSALLDRIEFLERPIKEIE